MPPTTTSSRRSLAALESCSGPCTLALLIGCTIPIVCVTSTLLFIWLKRRRSSRACLSKPRPVQQTVIPTQRSSFGMLYSRLSTMSMNRQSTLIDPDHIAPYNKPSSSPVNNVDSDNSPRLSLRSSTSTPAAHLLEIPTLPSILGDFLSFSDAIASNSNGEILPYQKTSAPPQEDPRSREIIFKAASPKVDSDVVRSPSPRSPSVTMLNGKADSPAYQLGMLEDPFEFMEVEELSHYLAADAPQGVNLSSDSDNTMDVTTTLWSILATSTLETLTTVRLDDFPLVPSTSVHSISPIFRTVSPSGVSIHNLVNTSIPTILHLFDNNCTFEQIHKDPSQNLRHLFDVHLSLEAGQLWDDEDDRRFSYPCTRMASPLVKPIRNTWTAGMLYSLSCSPGELWDEDDELLLSRVSASSLKALSTLASISYVSLELSTSDSDLDKTLSTDSHLNLFFGMEATGVGAKICDGENETQQLEDTIGLGCLQPRLSQIHQCVCQEIFVYSDCICNSGPPSEHADHLDVECDCQSPVIDANNASSPAFSQDSFVSFPEGQKIGSKVQRSQDFIDYVIDMDVEADQSYSSTISVIHASWHLDLEH